MLIFVLFFTLSLSIIRAQAAIASQNYGVYCNGIGAVPYVLSKRAEPPVHHRVLMAMLLKYIPGRFWETSYELIMVFLLSAVGYTTYCLYGLPMALVILTLAPLTFRFDYWDWIPELGAAIAATSGNIRFAIPWFILHALSKETYPLLPVIWICYGGNLFQTIPLVAVLLITSTFVRFWQGKKSFDRQMIGRNANDLLWYYQNGIRNVFLRSDMTGTLVITALTVVSCIHIGFPQAIPWMIILLAGWILAIAQETRVFSICLVPIAIMLIELISH